MQQVNVFACAGDVRSGCVRSGLVRIHSIYATALKPPREAGGRGGESTAREACNHQCHLFGNMLKYS
ncbi:hypothetical protein P3446_01330 [Escherichia coli]|nr:MULTISPECIES: hypothetical protein [Enterobacteriaceae]MBQ4687149.1 hypothetical protein [Escherichia coli]MDF4162416.1 hypothetical protein [Escherichia coli]MDR5912013.1 hypothetical protein [Escherichia coli]MDR5931805.1 hypothetical protein [Escherichia coli]OYL59814.1 hypothetical protein CI765_18230 [Shigella sonnei]